MLQWLQRWPSRNIALWVLSVVAGPLAVWWLSTGLSDFSQRDLDLVRAALCGWTAVLLGVGPWLVRRDPKVSRVLLGVLAVMTLTASLITVDSSLRRGVGTPNQVSTWNFFHYYLGGKYFPEVGYKDLYVEALKADQQGSQRFRDARHYRDMDTYDMRPTARVRNQSRSEAWTDERWEEFKRDVATIGGLEGTKFWREPLRDRGYNPPPAWRLVGGTAAQLTDPSSAWQSGILMWIDPALVLLAFGYSVRTYGWWRSLVVLIGMASWIGTHRLFGGKLVQFDWLAGCWGALCCLKRGHYKTAGVLAAYATSVRVFPGAMMLGPAAVAAFAVIRERKWPARFTQLFGAGALTLAGLVLLSGWTSGRGLGSWVEFVHKNEVHNLDHKFNESRVGLPYLTTATPSTGISDDVPRQVREDNYDANRPLRWALQLTMVALLVLAARRLDLHDAAVLGFALVFAFAVSSRYYAPYFAFFLLLNVPMLGRARGPPQLAFRPMDIALFVIFALGYIPFVMREGNRTMYMTSNLMLLGYLLVTLVIKAFLERRSEPVAEATSESVVHAN